MAFERVAFSACCDDSGKKINKLNVTEHIFVKYENYIETFELTEQFRKRTL
jgi:hypothetical protein